MKMFLDNFLKGDNGVFQLQVFHFHIFPMDPPAGYFPVRRIFLSMASCAVLAKTAVAAPAEN